ncbi:MAG: Hpt domain-containing protein [Sterolibacteriaceae bacterium]|nr:Hpt domain-containing protein [Candidatus Methylophosphatis haderslevensis]
MMHSAADTDLGPLSWVKGEIDLALGRSAEALDLASDGDNAQLRFAHTHLHQAHGALSIVGLDGLTQFSEALEQLVGELTADNVTGERIALAKRAIGAMRQFLDELVAGSANQPLRLMPLYEEIQLARGQPKPARSELFFPDLMLRPPRREVPAAPLTPPQLRLERARLERGVLEILRGKTGIGLQFMRTAVATVERAQTLPATRALWWVTLGLIDGLLGGHVELSTEIKKLCARIDGQMRKLAEGSTVVGERLMRDVLYQVAVAPPATPLIREIQSTYRVDSLIPTADSALEASVHKPRLRTLRELLTEAKEAWNRFGAGTAVALPQFEEKIQALRTEIEGLGRADFAALAQAVQDTTQWLRKDPLRHSDQVAMEMATALLVLETGIEQFAQPGSDFAQQGAAMVARLGALQRGEAAPAAQAPLLGELSRRAQERLLLSQVAREIQASLGQIEQALDTYFRDPARHGELGQLDAPLKQVEGALAMLGEIRAITVLREAAAEIRDFSQLGSLADPKQFESVAHKLSALGFYVESLQHGNANLETLLSPGSKTAPLREEPPGAAMEDQLAQQLRDAQVLAAQLKDKPEDDSLRQELRHNLEAIRKDATIVADSSLEQHARDALHALAAPEQKFDATATDVQALLASAASEPAAMPGPSADTTRLAESSSEQIDAELLEIFLQEAHEVLGTIGDNLVPARNNPRDREVLTTIRRGFHTLKGSSRMVGLKEFGEAAWGVEQVMNRLLQDDEACASPSLFLLIDEARQLFSAWVRQLETGGPTYRDASAALALAERVKAGEDVVTPAPATPAEGMPPPAATSLAPALPASGPEDDSSVHFAETIVMGDALRAGQADELDAPSESETLMAELTFDEPAGDEVINLEDSSFDVQHLPTLGDEAANEPAAGSLETPVDTPPAEQPARPAEPASISLGGRDISPGLLDMFLTEARGHIATLRRELARLHVNPALLPPEPAVRAAHTLAGIASTIGAEPIHDLGRALESAQTRLIRADLAPNADQSALLNSVATVLEGMVASIAERLMPHPAPDLIDRLASIVAAPAKADVIALRVVSPPAFADVPAALEHPVPPPAVVETPAVHEPTPPAQADFLPAAELPTAHEERRRKLRLSDDLDEQLLPMFLEEADDLQREIGAKLRQWRGEPELAEHAQSLSRLLHTLKGSARMAGAMGLGELVHAMESRVEQAGAEGAVTAAFLDELEASYDHAGAMIERLRSGEPSTPPAAAEAAPEPVANAAAAISTSTLEDLETELAAQRAMVRVRAELIDRFVNEAGEISISRTRIEGEMRTLRSSLLDLTENVIRLRNQLREIEIQAESQMQSRLALAQTTEADFDPLEMDRYTRLQEVTRMMAESVNDVTTVQHNLLRNLDAADAALTAQSRLNRDLHQGLMSMRLMPFDSIAERLYRVVRQTAKDQGKKVNLDLRGGQIEIDRGVLDKMTAPIEHLLRNSVTHGIESRQLRAQRGKPEIGQIVLALTQEGNDVAITMTDDGGGLDFDRIRAKGLALGMLQPDQAHDQTLLTNLIFAPGFSTAEQLTEVAGRGVGMDVVQSETATVGGRIEIHSEAGAGARFSIVLPQTTAVTQALLVHCAGRTYAIPSSMVEQVSELKQAALDKIVAEGVTEWMGERYPYHYLPRLLGDFESLPETGRLHWILLLRAGAQRIALRVDALRGNQEIVLKKTGPQLARVIGIAGATVLGDGEIVLMLNPIALAARELRSPHGAVPVAPRVEPPRAPTVMVVDDSLTVRKITGRLLERAGYEVLTAKDGVDALEQLIDVVPEVMLVDIEMPRMDGFDLTRNVRADERTKRVPIIMITSRIADKHRNYAMEIGVNHYLGKPYQEEELLALIAGYAAVPATA